MCELVLDVTLVSVLVFVLAGRDVVVQKPSYCGRCPECSVSEVI